MFFISKVSLVLEKARLNALYKKPIFSSEGSLS